MENTGGFEVGRQLRWARRLEQGAALAAAYVAGGLTVGAAVVAAHVTPLPIALDLAQSGLVLLLVLAVIAGLIHRAVWLLLRGQRDVRERLDLLSARLDSVSPVSPFDGEVRAAVADIARAMDRRR
ncbi:MAG: hypothetical protein IRZ05_18235 [Micromonosporaceae bacterium]|nr:hypothetical protein [Micromonosporaceae bacterium]